MNSMFRQFEEDPFFSGFHARAPGIDDMYAFRSPFLALDSGNRADFGYQQQPGHHNVAAHRGQRGSEMMPLDPFGFMNSMMSNMNSMMGNMFQQMNRMQNDPNGHCFTQSTVMSYTNDGSGQPKVYQATTSSRQAPGGIRETRRAVRDTEAGIEKMAVGRHMNDRAHIVTRQRNTRTGDMDENQDYINLDEEEAERFNNEWTRKTSQYSSRPGHSLSYQQRSTQPRALEYSRQRDPAVTSTASRHQ